MARPVVPHPRAGSKENVILVADDDMFMRVQVNKALQGMCRVVETARGDEVLEMYREHRPNMVLLDIHLPGTPGDAVLRDIMALDANAHVVMLSADSKRDQVLAATKMGAKGFITKPFSRNTLLDYLTRCPTIHYADG